MIHIKILTVPYLVSATQDFTRKDLENEDCSIQIKKGDIFFACKAEVRGIDRILFFNRTELFRFATTNYAKERFKIIGRSKEYKFIINELNDRRKKDIKICY
jgi:hypothetical protein